MITLNTDKGIVKVDDWNEIISRPGFDGDLNPKNHKLDTIIGNYYFGDKVPCGLSSCHTPHSKGYLVSTSSGLETNIGKDCGKKYFGVDFETLSKRFDNDLKQSNYRESLWAFKHQFENYSNRIDSLRKGNKERLGADELNKRLSVFKRSNGGLPKSVQKKISGMIRAKDNAIRKQRVATAKEFEFEKIRLNNHSLEWPFYIEEKVSELVCIDCLYKENDLRTLVIIDIEEGLRKFSGIDIDELSFSELKYWSKWKGGIDSKIDRAEKVVIRGNDFIREDNLSCLFYLVEDKDDKAALMGVIKDIVR